MAGELAYFEIPTTDAEQAQEFYGRLLGWEFAQGNFPGYHMIPNATPYAGLSAGEESRHPRVFFAVDDLEAAGAMVASLGGEADEPVQILAGTFARCRDDQGTHFTLWQGAPGAE